MNWKIKPTVWKFIVFWLGYILIILKYHRFRRFLTLRYRYRYLLHVLGYFWWKKSSLICYGTVLYLPLGHRARQERKAPLLSSVPTVRYHLSACYVYWVRYRMVQLFVVDEKWDFIPILLTPKRIWNPYLFLYLPALRIFAAWNTGGPMHICTKP